MCPMEISPVKSAVWRGALSGNLMITLVSVDVVHQVQKLARF